MTINKLISFIILSLIGLTGYGLYNQNTVLILIGHILTLPSIGVWYGFKRNWNTSTIDIATYLTYFVGSFSDSIILIGQEIGEILQILITLCMHLILIVIFRKEGTRIYSDRLQDLPKLLPIIVIFIFFGLVMRLSLPDALYFISIVYAIVVMILVAHGLFRVAKGKSYFWVAAGVLLLIIKDVLYCYNFFIYQNTIRPLYVIQNSLSGVVYFMIAIGIAQNQRKATIERNDPFWLFAKKYFHSLIDYKDIISIKKKTTHSKRETLIRPQMLFSQLINIFKWIGISSQKKLS
ncbi:hypothetical protein Emtol_4261 [Emticicia oligotrophica DSM 17448]|uniref:YhhN-like protein n=1 Tax=Emticicia oligotrophica (strain DSM 17448 / CIP 109782 / MTCC 6937 / GPTSA100-15) TaxID=929562 RepID=A0ABM5N7H1_EMTOG|nr:hypothetical protein [Emticicia oligotrophica]AFK05384.1 hypothetical protein Emtol_4261 [Emticicia oligotrophica DSM 17448]